MEEGSTLPLTHNGFGISNFNSDEDTVDGIALCKPRVCGNRQTTNDQMRTGLRVQIDGIAPSRNTIDATDKGTPKDAIPPLFLAIQVGDVQCIRRILRESPNLLSYSGYCGFPPLHHACNVKNIQSLKEILQHGENICAYDTLGNTPLHIAVNEAWHEGIMTLLNSGASPDIKSEPPNSVKEMRLMTPFHAAVKNGDVVVTKILLAYQPDLTSTDSNNSSILHLAASARNLEIVRILLERKECLELMNIEDCHGNNVLHSALRKECEPEVEATVYEIIKLLNVAGADINGINLQGETPIFLAAKIRMPKVVEYFLSQKADLTQVTGLGQTILHAACYSGCAPCLSQILNTGLLKAFVIRADEKGREPFHYAVQSSSIDCCELLLNNGDHLTRKDKDGTSRYSLILNHMPSATQLLQRLFDAHVRLANKPIHDPQYSVCFDYSVLLSQDDNDVQSSLMSDLTSSRLEHLLKHPLLESFLYFKWQKIKTFFYLSVFVYFLYLLLHTIFIILTFGHMQINWSEHRVILSIFIALHVLMYCFILIPDVIIWLANFKKYVRHFETYSKIIALLSSALVLLSCTVPMKIYIKMGFQSILPDEMDNDISLHTPDNAVLLPDDTLTVDDAQNNTQNVANISLVRYIAAISAFFSWIEFMMLLGRFPSLGAYVLMFTRVAKSIIKFMLAFSSLLMGFALSFMVLFYNSPSFKNFPLSLIKTLMMMIGEIEYGEYLKEAKLPTITLISLVFFLFLVCIVMTNLLIGLAVNDIPDLQRQGKIRRLGKQAAYLTSYEKLIRVARGLRCFPSSLRLLMASRCIIPKEISLYPNRECKSRKYKKCLPPETIQEAILLGNNKDTKDDYTEMEEEDMRILLKSFRMRYNSDRRALNKKLAQIPDSLSFDKSLSEHLEQMKQMMDIRFMQLFQEMKQQWQQNQHGSHVVHLQSITHNSLQQQNSSDHESNLSDIPNITNFQ